jgi:dihydroorotase
MPGLIDLHVHLRDPGLEYKEDISTGTRAAARGGVTTLCAMPNTKPVVDCPKTLEGIYKKADQVGVVHVEQVSAITKGMAGEELVDMEAMAKAGAIAFSEDGKSVMDIRLYQESMKEAGRLKIPVMAHCEDKNLVGKGVLNEGVASERFGVPGITNSVEDVITARDIFLAAEAGARLHLCHCSTKGAVALTKMAKEMGMDVSAEVCPHHFILTDADITELDSNYKMNPPLRTEEDVKALIQGLADGTMEVISTDHAPHHKDEKPDDFQKAAFGIVGIETSASLTYTALVATGILTPYQMVEKMSTNPARIIGIDNERGGLRPGMEADIAIFDPEAEYIIDPEQFASKGKNTPFAGKAVKGQVAMTLVGGQVVYDRTKEQEK